jgi:hypothetical protein
MKRSTERILTTHAGSLVRPPEIVAVLKTEAFGEPYDQVAFTGHLRTAVTDVVRRQAEVGIDIPNDGEFGKVGWNNYVLERFSGLELHELPPGATPAGPRQEPPGLRRAECAPVPSATRGMPPSSGTSSTSRQRWPRRAWKRASCPWPRPAAWRHRTPMSTTRATRLTCTPSPTPCARNTGPSSTPACFCRSTTPSYPTWTTGWWTG